MGWNELVQSLPLNVSGKNPNIGTVLNNFVANGDNPNFAALTSNLGNLLGNDRQNQTRKKDGTGWSYLPKDLPISDNKLTLNGNFFLKLAIAFGVIFFLAKYKK